jgi:hypothetical protein
LASVQSRFPHTLMRLGGMLALMILIWLAAAWLIRLKEKSP